MWSSVYSSKNDFKIEKQLRLILVIVKSFDFDLKKTTLYVMSLLKKKKKDEVGVDDHSTLKGPCTSLLFHE